VGGVVRGKGSRVVAEVAAPLDCEQPEALIVVWDKRSRQDIHPGEALFTRPGWIPEGEDGVECDAPRERLLDLLPLFAPRRGVPSGIHPTAVVQESAFVHPEAVVGPQCVVSAGAVLAAGVNLEAQCFVGENVTVGADSRLEPQVVLYHDVVVGERVLVHSGTVIGCDGFGFLQDEEGRHRKIPQIGNVVVEDEVEVGACCSIDRATMGSTRIGRGSIIDDHVHVGHNVQIGERCILVAFAGLAGSSKLGDDVVMAARSGTAPHVRVGSGTSVTALSGVMKDTPEGLTLSGFPARDHWVDHRARAHIRRLPEFSRRLRQLEAELKRLKGGESCGE
ncbi:MAG: UDP-3-O-(3-hydroxymyristoyl)glucosamine N-acyltransferase, partial [Synergistales bacterium]|nr:UDP-3-O-(3-hydroxymyristoyl)glucosamine N-acyltransferase [Synergistales bacterium]